MAKILQILLFFFCLSHAHLTLAQDLPHISMPKQLSGEHVLILTKQGDALSQRIAQYYAQQRHVPQQQIVTLSLPPHTNQLTSEQFARITKQISPQLTDKIKVILLTFHTPYRVDCMSITSAFSLGFDEQYCSQKPQQTTTCSPTKVSPYFNNNNDLLWQRKAPIKLSMMLSATSFKQAKSLIDRGIAADNSYPSGYAYLVKTDDRARSSRAPTFKRFAEIWQDKLNIKTQFIDDSHYHGDTSIRHKKDILFYHTGLTHVPDIDTNSYLPGAIADHLTSGAGIGIGHDGQMKAFRWLESGVTASYGAVIEPCNFPEKFPNPQILIPHYANGDSLIEAYWKSVQQPGEGLFIGEPLARPWSPTFASFEGNDLLIHSKRLNSNTTYHIEQRENVNARWQDTPEGVSGKQFKTHLTIRIPNAKAQYYRITEHVFYPGISQLPK